MTTPSTPLTAAQLAIIAGADIGARLREMHTAASALERLYPTSAALRALARRGAVRQTTIAM